MIAPPRTYQKSTGMYYIRLRIPKNLISRTSKPIFIYSLGTKDRHEAYVKSLRINLEFEEWISKVSNNKNRFPALAVEHNGSKFDFDMTIPAEKDAYYDLVENIGRFKPKAAEPVEPPPPIYLLTEVLAGFGKAKNKVYAEATFGAYISRMQSFIDYADTKGITDIACVGKVLAVEYRDHINTPDASPLTVDNHTKSIKQCFDYAIQMHQYAEINPFAGLHLLTKAQREVVTDSYIPFRPEELKRLFNFPVYAKRFSKPDLFYSPLISLTMGLRLEELAQLRVTDIYQIDNVWVIDINDDGDDKDLKTPSAKRILPLPRFLLSTNFLDYHQHVFDTYGENSHLYPYLIRTKNGYGKNIGYNFTEYKKKLITVTPELKTFHSLRKNVGEDMAKKGYDLSLRKYVLGHSNTDVTDKIYGGHTPKSFLYTKLNALDYDDIDFDAFHFDFEADGGLDKLIAVKRRKEAAKVDVAS